MNASLLRLYLVADPDHVNGDLVPVVEDALSGGVTMVQLRAKSLSDRERLALALKLEDSCARHGVPFIVNDRLDIALASNADGVHLGVNDLPVEAARQLANPDFIIGYSPDTEPQIATAQSAGADYLGIGPVFGTGTKADAGSALGIDEFAQRCKMSPVPVVGIGGINATNAGRVFEAGASGIAVVSAILRSPHPHAAARDLILTLAR